MSIQELVIDNSIHQLFLVSGKSGAGKTKWCSAQVIRAREQGLTVGGLLSPGVFRQGVKVGIELINLATNEKRLLAEVRPEEIPNAPTRKWAMNHQTLEWGNIVLQTMGYYDLVVIDELGPLEFLHGRGFQGAFDMVERRRYKTAVVVVRSSLLEAAQKTWSGFDLRIHSLDG